MPDLGVLRVRNFWPAGRVGYSVVPSGRAGSGQPSWPIISGRVGPGQAKKIQVISGQNLLFQPSFFKNFLIHKLKVLFLTISMQNLAWLMRKIVVLSVKTSKIKSFSIRKHNHFGSALKISGTGRVGSRDPSKFQVGYGSGILVSLLRVGSISGRVITCSTPRYHSEGTILKVPFWRYHYEGKIL